MGSALPGSIEKWLGNGAPVNPVAYSHSAATADGYRVPLLVWGAGIANLPPATFSQPVRTDWLGHSVMHLLGIDWLGHLPEKNVLDTRYRWRAPPLPMVADFAS